MMNHARATPAGPGRAGFSLIEMTMVIVMIAITASIVVPRFGNSMDRYRAEAAARRVATDLLLAQATARAAGAAREVLFTAGKNQYEICDLADNPHLETDLANIPYNAVVVSASLGGDSAVRFDGFGTPDSGGTIAVRVGKVTKTVTLEAQSGRTSVN